MGSGQGGDATHRMLLTCCPENPMVSWQVLAPSAAEPDSRTPDDHRWPQVSYLICAAYPPRFTR